MPSLRKREPNLIQHPGGRPVNALANRASEKPTRPLETATNPVTYKSTHSFHHKVRVEVQITAATLLAGAIFLGPCALLACWQSCLLEVHS
jgi:hypothetical protein